jgi:transposase
LSKLDRACIGIDAGKGHHWAVAIDAAGTKKMSRKVPNGEADILDLIAAGCDLAEEVTWAVDISGRSSTLLIALLTGHGQHVVYLPGRTVNRMSSAYRGEGKTDAKDALVIADQARMRTDFAPLSTPTEQTLVLQLLTKQRADLTADKVRLVNRLRDLLIGIFRHWNARSTTTPPKGRSPCSPNIRPQLDCGGSGRPAWRRG